MSSDDSRDESALKQFVNELGFSESAGMFEEILAAVDELHDTYKDLNRAVNLETESTGEFSDDEYNALLDIYEEPRKLAMKGPLDGVSLAIKDNIAVRGLRMTCGLQNFTYVPTFDATVIKRLLNAGASIVGKANMDPLALGPGGQWSEFGPVINPVDENRITGGSSSGSGAAVAAGLVEAALGTDTGGSVRSPAACCGVVGIKPTYRRVSRHGMVGLRPSTDVIGPIARDVDTARRVLQTISGHDINDPTSSLEQVDDLGGSEDYEDVTIGIMNTALEFSTDDIADAVCDLGSEIEDYSHVTVEQVDLDFGEFEYISSIMTGAEFAWAVRQSFIMHGHGEQYERELCEAVNNIEFNDHILNRILPAAFIDMKTGGGAYQIAREKAIEFKHRMLQTFEQIDIALAPTLRILPPKPFSGEHETSDERIAFTFTSPFSLTGGPVVSIPIDQVNGLPISVQLIAPEFCEREAIECAYFIEEIRHQN